MFASTAPIDFGGENTIDYDRIAPSPHVPRHSFLGENVKPHVKVQRGLAALEQHYPLREFYNR